MKHDLSITLFLIFIFLLTQVVGLFFINHDAKPITITKDNRTVTEINHQDTAVGPRPETKGFSSFLYLGLGVLIGTVLVLILIKYSQFKLWKIWFFIAVWIATTIALGVFVNKYVAVGIALVIAIIKLWKPNILIHNLSEVLMYTGIAVLVVPLFNVLWAFILLVAISLYDMYAVWKSKHMVKMAEFQTKSNLFAGLMIPYRPKKEVKINSKLGVQVIANKENNQNNQSTKPTEKKNAILGGGDVAFPLIFAGVIMEALMMHGFSKIIAFQYSLMIALTTAIALFLLFMAAKKDKFYPAMPFVTLGCVAGYLIIGLFTGFFIF